MKKILILANSATGLLLFRRELLSKLIENNIDVHFSVPQDSDDEYVKEIVQIGAKHHFTKINRRGLNPIQDFKLLIDYFNLLKEVRPDIVLSYTIKPNVYGGFACNLKNIPFIANITGLGTAVENEGILQKVSIILYKFVFRKAKRVFVQNAGNKLFLEHNNVVPKKLKLLPGSGINLERFKQLPFPCGDIIKFVFISRIMKEKGIDLYLETAEYIKTKYNNTEFHICGACEEDYATKLESLEKRGIIKYHGKVKDVRNILKQVHCTIHPTYYPEGMSNVLLESAACSRPIITTDRNGCKEVVDDGITGYICKQKDLKDLIEKIEKFIQLPHEEKMKMGLRGREKVEKEFDRNIVINAYMHEINNILGN